MPSAARIVRQINDTIDALDAVKGRVVLAEQQAKGANRQANRLGTTVTGGRGGDATMYGNPVQDETFRLLATMEQGEAEAAALKQAAYHLADLFREWAKSRPADNGVRRCGADDCARPHVARGLCDMHRKRLERAESRQKAIDAQKAER